MAAEVRERLVATAYLSQSGLGRDGSGAEDFLDAGLPSYYRLGRDRADARNCSGAGLPSYYRLVRDRADRSQDFMS